MDVVSDIVGLSDQKVIEKKTKCFALKDPPAFFSEGKALGTTDKVKIVGVTWVFKDGYFELDVPDSTVEEMRALAHRIRYSGVPFQHRVLLCGSLIMSKILHGTTLIPSKKER